MRQAITWTNDDPVHWCIYAALEGDEYVLTKLSRAEKCHPKDLEKAHI